MNHLYAGILVVGTLGLLLGLFAAWFQERWYLTEPLVALLVGVALGPVGLGIFRPETWGDPTRALEEASRVTLAVADMGVALRLPSGYVFRHWRALLFILGVGMPLTWLLSGALIWGLLGISLWASLLIGATVTSTDPVVATTIVTGSVAEQHVPARLRHLISAESGANDGMVYPLVLLPILILTRPAGEALSHWITGVVGWQVGGAVVVGASLGYGASWLLQWSEKVKIVEPGTFLAYTFALTLVVLGAARLLEMDGVLAAFVSGLAFRMAPGAEYPTEEQEIQKAMTKFFTLPAFVLVGLAIPWTGWWELGWTGLLLAVLTLLLRRPPVIFGLSPWLKPLQRRRDTLFVGWADTRDAFATDPLLQ